MFKLAVACVAAASTTTLAVGEKYLGEIDSNQFKRVVVIPSVYGNYEIALNSIWHAYNAVEGSSSARVTWNQFEELFSGAVEAAVEGGCAYSKPEKPAEVLLIQMGNMGTKANSPVENERTRALFGVAIPQVLGWEVRFLLGRGELDFLAIEPKECIGAQVLFGKPKDPEWGRDAVECRDFKAAKEEGLTMIRWAARGKSGDTASTLFVHGDVFESWVGVMMSSLNPFGTNVGNLNEIIRSKLKRGSTTNLRTSDSPFLSTLSKEATLPYLCSKYINFVQKKFKVFRVVVDSHPQANHQVNTFCSGRLVFTNAKSAASAILLQAASPNSAELQSMSVVYRGGPSEELWFPDYLRASAEAGKRINRLIRYVRGTAKNPEGRSTVVVGPELHGSTAASSGNKFVRSVVDGYSGIVLDWAVDDTAPPSKDAIEKLAKVLKSNVIFYSPRSLFVEAQCDAMLSVEIARGFGPRDMRVLKDGVDRILSKIKSFNIDLGIQTSEELLNSFCVSAGGDVSFINWARVKFFSSADGMGPYNQYWRLTGALDKKANEREDLYYKAHPRQDPSCGGEYSTLNSDGGCLEGCLSGLCAMD